MPYTVNMYLKYHLAGISSADAAKAACAGVRFVGSVGRGAELGQWVSGWSFELKAALGRQGTAEIRLAIFKGSA